MSKKRFVQEVVIRSLPPHGKLAAAIHYAENLWDGLTQHGYGQDEPTTPRQSKHWFNQLNDRQQRQFVAFWKAFAFKKDANGAAMRWGQLGDLSDEEAGLIISAAAKEAQKPLPPGQARKMAQGWLFEKRWLDHKPEPKDARQQKNHVLSHLKNELAAVKRLHEASGDNALKAQIQQLEQAIANATK